MASLLYASPQRGNGVRDKDLPSYSSAVYEKGYANGHGRNTSFFTWVYVPIPGVQGRQLRVILPIPPRLYHSTLTRFGRKRGCTLLTIGFVCALWILFAFAKRFGTENKQWPTPFQGDPPTLVFEREDLRKVWEWEIASGHYPSRRKSARVRFDALISVTDIHWFSTGANRS
jgi:WD repeat and SOF domain-containing protein 1